MKKYIGLFLSLIVGLLLVTGCEKVESGNYKEGTYFGSATSTSNGTTSVTTTVIYVNENGMIKSVFIDNAYTKDKVLSTKKALGSAYGMKVKSEVGKEWYEQANLIEAKVVENQGTTFIKLSDSGETDSIAGVTMNVSAIYESLNSAINQAKK